MLQARNQNLNKNEQHKTAEKLHEKLNCSKFCNFLASNLKPFPSDPIFRKIVYLVNIKTH